jgi:hypothetical protein
MLGIRRTVGYILLPILVYLGDMGVESCTKWIDELETTSAITSATAAASAAADATPASPAPTAATEGGGLWRTAVEE